MGGAEIIPKDMITKKTSKAKKIIEKEKTSYTAKDIQILGGLEPVRKRPGMYIGSTGVEGVHHLLTEIVGNSIDEAIMGYCDEIEVALLPNNRAMIKDNGRGIPVDKHPKTKKSALETIMTHLHTGAKFGGKAYATTGGLHGVGISVVSALSKYMRVEVCIEKNHYSQEYSRGKPTTKLEKIGKCDSAGTTVIFEPDPQVFEEIKWNSKKILSYLRQQAFLTKGVKITFLDKREKQAKSYSFYFEGGLVSYIKYLTQGRDLRHPHIFYGHGERDGILVEVALAYTKEFEAFEGSFANNVFTTEGGMHLTGFRMALTRALNDFFKGDNSLKNNKEDFLTGKDVREGLTGIVSVKIKEPQFEGQTKKKLGNPPARKAVAEVMFETFSDFLASNPRDARAIIESCVLAQKAREAAKSARETVFKKGILRTLALPGKLADCSSRKPEESELFIVEGKSAGGSAQQARNRRFQAILPLRGKILNVEKARLGKILANKEIKSLIIAMGTAVAEDFDISRLRYHKIIIMQDADVDGAHINTLFLTLFYRYFKPLIENDHVYLAQPPLYKIKIGKEIKYTYTEEEKDRFIKQFKGGNKSIDIQRYKGLGEMNPEELWETTMNPENRVLLKIEIGDAESADRIFDTLMGEEVLPRKKFIQAYARKVKNLDI